MMKKFGMFAPMAMSGAIPNVETVEEPMMKVTAKRPEQKRGLFSPDFADKLSVIGGLLMQNAGNPLGGQIVGNYYQRQENNRLMERQAAQAEAERAQKREDTLWEWQNKPQNPYRWEANDGSLMELGPDGRPRIAYQDPTPKLQFVPIRNEDGTTTIMPIGPSGPMSSDNPQVTTPVGKLTPITEPTQPAPRQFPYERTVHDLPRNPQGAYMPQSMKDLMMIPDGASYVDLGTGQVLIKGQL